MSVELNYANNNFYSDEEKMRDFATLTKERFLESYSYLTENEYDNTRQILIDELKSRVRHNHICNIKELEQECEKFKGAGIDAYEEVILPMGYNTCEICGDIEDSEFGLFWIDGFDWQEDNEFDEAVLKSLEAEPYDYCAICYPCLHKLANKGRNSENVEKAKKYYTEEYVVQVKKENGGEPVCFDEFYWSDWQEIKKLLK